MRYKAGITLLHSEHPEKDRALPNVQLYCRSRQKTEKQINNRRPFSLQTKQDDRRSILTNRRKKWPESSSSNTNNNNNRTSMASALHQALSNTRRKRNRAPNLENFGSNETYFLPHPPCTNCRSSSSKKPRRLLANLSRAARRQLHDAERKKKPSPPRASSKLYS